MNKNTTVATTQGSVVVTPPTNFTEAYFAMNGLIHDIKTFFASEVRNPKASEVIRRECTKLSAKGSIVGRDAFKNVLYDYDLVVMFNEVGGKGIIVTEVGVIEFALI